MKLLIDIHSKKPYPSGSLSNFAEHPYCLDGIPVKSQEGLLQSLKLEPHRQREVCQLAGKAAKEAGSGVRWQENGGIFHWNGVRFSRYSREYIRFLERAYDAQVDQNPEFARALRDTGPALLWHGIGKFSRRKTCLTTFEFLYLLYRARKRAQRKYGEL